MNKKLMAGSITAGASLLLDAVLGEKALLPHPVRLMGKGITIYEKILRGSLPKTPEGEIAAGGITAALTAGGTWISSKLLFMYLRRFHPAEAFFAEVLLGWKCLSMKGLSDESLLVREKLLFGSIEEARRQVGRIVGRDTAKLGVKDVSRAAVETVAENFSDGVTAPLFYLWLGGAPLSLAYKAVNTMDSMLGYKNDAYMHFGKIPARVDDAANYVPSRISAWLLIFAAAVGGEDAGGAARVWRRDRRKHESPNSAQTEAAMAGALGIELGGPASYFGKVVRKPVLGRGGRACSPDDIVRADRMLLLGSVFGLLFTAAGSVLID